MKKKLPAKKYIFSSTKKGKIGDDDKKPDGHITFKDCWTMCCDVSSDVLSKYCEKLLISM